MHHILIDAPLTLSDPAAISDMESDIAADFFKTRNIASKEI